ncbi:MAG: L-alanine exporter AlaE [Alphaproteobacteria bacterium]|nr:L-alanine exporter AlaE [Alphaproteobacteria bacterium]
MKAFLVDTITSILFFTVIVGVLELLVVGLEPNQVLMTRLFTLPVIALTGRPYGLWRDWVFARLRPSRWLTKAFADVGAFVSFQLPVYLATLAFVGATAAEMLIASGMAILGMSILSRPFGLFLEFVRKRAGILAFESGNLS